MSCVFLSASIPLPQRNQKYYETADVVAIRDSIRALVAVVVPDGKIVFGGHPAITPLIRQLIREMRIPVRKHVALFQSLLLKPHFPPDNDDFENLQVVEAVGDDHEASLSKMRKMMIHSENFDAGVFIGGMEGVEDEYALFRQVHPNKPAYPIGSTGAAALLLYDRYTQDRRELKDNLLYLSLFRSLLVHR